MTGRRSFLTMLGLAPIAATVPADAFGKSEITLDDRRVVNKNIDRGKIERAVCQTLINAD